MTYFNSTSLTGLELRAAITAARHQDAAILVIFQNARGPLSPSDVWRLCEQAGKQWPLTSVRRAITTLTSAGALTQTGFQKRGIYGRLEYCWTALEDCRHAA